MKTLTIGQVARESGVGVETIRFYQREGLIATPPRRSAGYRQYGAGVLRRIRFILRGKGLGFSLREINALLSLSLSRGRSCADVKARAHVKIEGIRAQIAALERIKGALERLTDACTARGSASMCPILDALDADVEGDK